MAWLDSNCHKRAENSVLQARSILPSTPIQWQDALLATKFFIPVASHSLISRHRLTALLDESFKYPLTLVSAPAGFGKTTLVASWSQSLSTSHRQVAWISLDEEDNDPRLFWTYVLTALNRQQPERFNGLLMHLQSSELLLIKQVLVALINLLAEGTDHFLLILDDYQVISEPQIQSSLAYLIEHLPAQLRIILTTRSDPPLLLLSLLRARKQVLEIRTDQLRCTVEETGAFFHEVVSISLPDETIQQIRDGMEGWLVGLQLLGLSLPEQADPASLLQEMSGDQHYILDYLTEVVLLQQPQEVQSFLLCTSLLDQLNASLCDAVMDQSGSQQMLQQLESANLFVVSLDNRREQYRYHALFAQALRCRLEQTHADLVQILHHRASLWYAKHEQTAQAILHAFSAHQWQWAADLIELKQVALNALTWGLSKQKMHLFQEWLLQMPMTMFHARPRLCLAATWMLLPIAPQSMLKAWLTIAEAALITQLVTHERSDSPVPQVRLELENLLGEVITYRALLQSLTDDGEAALMLSQRAQALLSVGNFGARAHIAVTQLFASYASSSNDAVAAIQIGREASSRCQKAGYTDQAISLIGVTAMHMIGTGKLQEVKQFVQRGMLLASKSGRVSVLPGVTSPMIWQAEILREWNQLDKALSIAQESMKLCEQIESALSLIYLHMGYAILLRIHLSRGEYQEARSALQEFECMGRSLNQPWRTFQYALFTTIDQVRLWLVCGELELASSWAKKLDEGERKCTPFAHEREEVACARILLAKQQPAQARERLELVLQRATAGQRWGHVIEIRILQALTFQMLQDEVQALSALSEAVRLAEPEGYIRSFVDEGIPMAALLSKLQQEQRQAGPTHYLDTVLATFPQSRKTDQYRSKRAKETIQFHSLLDPLSQREREVLQLLAQGASNQQIGQELVITIDTVKRHVSHIFAKLGVQNRVQALNQAQELGLLEQEG